MRFCPNCGPEATWNLGFWNKKRSCCVRCHGCGMRGPMTGTADDLDATEAWDALPRRPAGELTESQQRSKELETATAELRAPGPGRKPVLVRRFQCIGADCMKCPLTCPRYPRRPVAIEPGVCSIDHTRQVFDKEHNEVIPA